MQEIYLQRSPCILLNSSPNVTKETIVRNAFQTIALPDYYIITNIKQKVVIGSLEHLTVGAFGRTRPCTNNLTLDELNIISNNKWLSTISLELVSAILWQKCKLEKKEFVLSPNSGHIIFNGRKDDLTQFFIASLPNQTRWLIPFNIKNSH